MKAWTAAALTAAALYAAPSQAATVTQTYNIPSGIGGFVFSLADAATVTATSAADVLLAIVGGSSFAPIAGGIGSVMANLDAGSYGVVAFNFGEPTEVTLTYEETYGNVPLPASLPLLAGGLVIAGGAMRRRRAKSAA